MLPTPKMGLILLWCNRGVATGGRRAEGPSLSFLSQPPSAPLPSLLQFSNQFQFQTSRMLLVLRNYTDQKYHDFNCLCYNFYQFTAAFHFFKLHRRNRSLRVRTSKKDQYVKLYRSMPVCQYRYFVLLCSLLTRWRNITLYSFISRLYLRYKKVPVWTCTPLFQSTICSYAPMQSKKPLTYL